MNFVPDTLRSDYSFSAIMPGQVVMAAENIKIFQVNNPNTIKYLLELMRNEKIKIEVCYCSIYNDCWKSIGIEVIEDGCE